ncbi:hypothetical protein ACHAXA_011760 [Cyclostephanos tholiformis]|uniref:Cyclin-dependent kinases regulatory subunit n=1 Tax=Cyclostephanos tholiformis TaxID=382380 RepID=A0ABD3RXL8_9STRA
MSSSRIEYSEKYADEENEYRGGDVDGRTDYGGLIHGATWSWGGEAVVAADRISHMSLDLFFIIGGLLQLSVAAPPPHPSSHSISLFETSNHEDHCRRREEGGSEGSPEWGRARSATDEHVILPKELAKTLPKARLLTENEWRSIGVQQSRGWHHYAIHRPEPHILLFRRPLGTDPQTGEVDPELKRMALEEYKGQFGLRG